MGVNVWECVCVSVNANIAEFYITISSNVWNHSFIGNMLFNLIDSCKFPFVPFYQWWWLVRVAPFIRKCSFYQSISLFFYSSHFGQRLNVKCCANTTQHHRALSHSILRSHYHIYLKLYAFIHIKYGNLH